MIFPYNTLPLFFALLSIVSAGKREHKARVQNDQQNELLPPQEPKRGVVYYSRREFLGGKPSRYADPRTPILVIALGPVLDKAGKPDWKFTRVVEMAPDLGPGVSKCESVPAHLLFPKDQILYRPLDKSIPLKDSRSRINISHVRVLRSDRRFIWPRYRLTVMKMEETSVKYIEDSIAFYTEASQEMVGVRTPNNGALGRSTSLSKGRSEPMTGPGELCRANSI
ncbi:hypothetical protein APHAL10511_000718 [Amanita phalloides]|nr:hypothetical protein APHAL10511_000718 [Amanita phalloides]